jgi:tight adherence protein C
MMIPLYAASLNEVLPLIVFGAIVAGAWALMSALQKRSSAAEERLARLGRPGSEPDMYGPDDKKQRFSGLKEAIASMGGVMEGDNEVAKSKLRMQLTHAGFRSENAVTMYYGLVLFSVVGMLLPGGGLVVYLKGTTREALYYTAFLGCVGFFLPRIILWMIASGRKKEIFLTMPDALDLLVVCVESGLGLDAALRKVTEEMKEHAKTISGEFAMANMQLQMGRPRRDVLHDLGVRTGVDDMKALAAILIQADRFGSSIAQALRVQSDSMRTRRRQIAEEKAAKTAVQLIFPLVLFIFPAIFVVLVGPAAIQIQKGLFKG